VLRFRGIRALGFLLLLGLFGVSCGDGSHAVDYSLVLSLQENFETQPGTLVFLGSTSLIEDGPLSLPPSIRIGRRPPTLTFSYPVVRVPDRKGCRPAGFTTLTRGDLPPLEPGSWEVSFDVHGNGVSAALLVTDTTWELSGLSDRRVLFDRPSLHRMPRDAVWGSLSTSDTSLVREFGDSLAALGARGGFVAANYGRFEVDVAGIVAVRLDRLYRPGYPAFVPGFAAHFNGDLAVLRALADRFSARRLYADVRSVATDTISGYYAPPRSLSR
jgi:hypothetical protein